MLVLLIDPEYPLDQFAGLPGGIFPLITPPPLIVSMLFSDRTWDKGMRAVETLTPYPPALVLYTRLSPDRYRHRNGLAEYPRARVAIHPGGNLPLLFGPFILEWMGILLVTGGARCICCFAKAWSSH